MNKIIPSFLLLLLLGLISVSAADQDIFVISLKYDNGNVSVQSLVKLKGTFHTAVNTLQEGYNLSIISTDSKVLYSQLFDFALELHAAADPNWFDEEGNQIIFPDSQDVRAKINISYLELILPYYENAKAIEITNKSHHKIISLSVNQNTGTSAGSLQNAGNIPCILVSCSYSPRTCPSWGTQERTCVDSCTKEKLTEKVNCTPGARVGAPQEAGFWQRFAAWWKGVFGR